MTDDIQTKNHKRDIVISREKVGIDCKFDLAGAKLKVVENSDVDDVTIASFVLDSGGNWVESH